MAILRSFQDDELSYNRPLSSNTYLMIDDLCYFTVSDLKEAPARFELIFITRDKINKQINNEINT